MSSDKTLHPGMSAPEEGFVQPFRQIPFPVQESGRAVRGLLYSVSRTAAGEVWPVYEGANPIGRSGECTVRLAEATVAEEHATIAVRRETPEGRQAGFAAFIRNASPEAETKLNGRPIDGGTHPCRSGDVITAGAHYELYFVLLDADALGLAPQEEFLAAEDTPDSVYALRTPRGTLIPESSNPFESWKPNLE